MYAVTEEYISFALPGRLLSFDKEFRRTEVRLSNSSDRIPVIYAVGERELKIRQNNASSVSYYPSKGLWDQKYNSKYSGNYMITDKDGVTWLATDNSGVLRIEDETVTDTINVSKGLPDNYVYTVETSADGSIWISTTNGLAKYSPSSGSLINYGEANGMLYDLQPGRMRKSSSGEIFIHSTKHILKIRSESPQPAFAPPSPVITEVHVNNDSFYGYPEKLTVSYDENNLFFKFVSVDMMRSNLVKYQFMLEGHDRKWIDASSNVSANYNNLPHGKYRFLVRACFEDHEYSEHTELPIVIRPAFWQTLAFKLLVVILLIVVLLMAVKKKIRSKVRIAEYRLKAENDKLKVELYGNLSHLIRTPVSLINAPFKELVGRHDWDGDDRELIHIIEKNISNVMKLTSQLLEHWSGKDDVYDNVDSTLNLEMKDLSELLRDSAMMFRPTAISKGVDIYLDIPETLTVAIDEDKIVKILYNLISNSLKHTPKGGSVKISAAKDAKQVSISVIDTGCGVPNDLKEKIFDRFYHIDNNTSADSSFGIGLYHTRYLARMHNGEVTVRDNKPAGAIFTLTMPAESVGYRSFDAQSVDFCHDAEGSVFDEDPDVKSDDNGREHMLIVEDNIEMLEYMSKSLGRRYSVLCAKDGIEAMRFFGTESIDIVISDVMMPRMDGFALCKWIKESDEYCHIPVVLLTAKSSETDELEGISCGADAYITKPFEPQKLLGILENLLENRKRIQSILLHDIVGPRSLTDNLIRQQMEDGQLQFSRKDGAFMEKLYHVLDEHISDNKFGIIELCQEMGFSKTALYKKLKALTGATPNKLITDYRFSKVKDLMKTGEYSLSEIAYMTGFSSISTFSRRFHSVHGISPSEYLQSGGGEYIIDN